MTRQDDTSADKVARRKEPVVFVLEDKTALEALLKAAWSVWLHVLASMTGCMPVAVTTTMYVCRAQVRCDLDAVGAPVPDRRWALRLPYSRHDACPAHVHRYLSTAVVPS